MNVFNIDFNELVRLLTPPRLRQPIQLAWQRILAGPVIYLYNLFTANRNANLYYLNHNSQVVYLQAALNDAFDPIDREIVIVDAPVIEAVPVGVAAELQPVWVPLSTEGGATHIYVPTSGEVAATGGGDFIVEVPTAVTLQPGYSLVRLKAKIDEYRLPSKKNYTIQII